MIVDKKEFELPETVFIRDVETQVFQSIVLQCLSKINGIGLLEGNFFDSLLGREEVSGIKGVVVEQDPHHHSISVKVEINVAYGVSIPEKAEEIQTLVALEITRLTGLHVASVHVVFKNIIVDSLKNPASSNLRVEEKNRDLEYNDDF